MNHYAGKYDTNRQLVNTVFFSISNCQAWLKGGNLQESVTAEADCFSASDSLRGQDNQFLKISPYYSDLITSRIP